jgi:phosphatidylinositol alpha-1,6-mannosyltransferase
MRGILSGADAVTVLGDHTAGQLGSSGQEDWTYRLAGGVDPGRFPCPPDDRATRSHQPPTVVAVSRLVARKGLDELMRAWPRVLAELPDAELVVIGDGPKRAALGRAADSPALRGRVRLVGQLDHEALLHVLWSADVFVAPCRDRWKGLQTEGLGLATLEASSVGLPVVVAGSGGSSDAVRDGHTGLVVEARAPAVLAEALIRLLGDPDLARRMGRAGARWVRESWAWEAAAERLAGLVNPGLVQRPKMDWLSSSGHFG